MRCSAQPPRHLSPPEIQKRATLKPPSVEITIESSHSIVYHDVSRGQLAWRPIFATTHLSLREPLPLSLPLSRRPRPKFYSSPTLTSEPETLRESRASIVYIKCVIYAHRDTVLRVGLFVLFFIFFATFFIVAFLDDLIRRIRRDVTELRVNRVTEWKTKPVPFFCSS